MVRVYVGIENVAHVETQFPNQGGVAIMLLEYGVYHYRIARFTAAETFLRAELLTVPGPWPAFTHLFPD